MSAEPMPLHAEEVRRRQSCLEHALACAFWRVVQSEPMPVMDALEAAARALGRLYRETAAAHGPGGTCGCGWEPEPDNDRMILEAALAAAMRAPPAVDLAAMAVAGRA